MSIGKQSRGFTIVELIIVIIVIAILATIGVIAYRGAADDALEATLKSDLNQVAAQLEAIRHDQNSLPKDDSGLTVSSGTHLQYSRYASDMFCITTQGEGMSFYLDSETKVIKEGSCEDHSSGGVVGSGQWKQISAGDGHVCAIDPQDRLFCWGSNDYGQLGNGGTDSSSAPVAVTTAGALAGKTVKQVSAGYSYTCAVASDNKAYCWGGNDYGQLGRNSKTSSSVPVAVYSSGSLAGKAVKQVSTGDRHTCAIASDDKVYCWGFNENGQLGNNSNVDATSPVATYTGGSLAGKAIESVGIGYYHTCALASDGRVYCWGHGSSGQLGSGLYASSSTPVAVSVDGVLAGKTAKQLSVGGYASCLVASDDKVYCWGGNWDYELGNSTVSRSSAPMRVSGTAFAKRTIKQLSSGNSHVCALASDNKLYCWGYGRGEQFGVGLNDSMNEATQVEFRSGLGGSLMRSLSLGGRSTCVTSSTDSSYYCWGRSNDPT